jgi:hypothetical protein
MKNGIVKITDITIKIGGKSVKVTLDEARKLKEALDEIFPAQVEPVQIHWHHEPYIIPSQPYSPYWQFGAETTLGGQGVATTSATLSIQAEGNIIT